MDQLWINFEMHGTLKQGDHICNNFKNHAADPRQVDLQKVNDLLIHRAKAWILASSDIDLFTQQVYSAVSPYSTGRVPQSFLDT